MNPRRTLALLALTTLSAGTFPACSARADRAASASTAMHLHSERDAPLGEGGAPVHLALDASGARIDSLAVHLEARDAKNAVLYARDWPSGDYIDCQCDSTEWSKELPPLRQKAESYLRHAFDSAIVAPASDSGRTWERPDHHLAVMLQLVPQLWRYAPIASVDTNAVLAAVRAERSSPYDSLANAIMSGIRTRPALTYRTGVEGYCIAAYALQLRRMVDVLCGP